ncbi:nucleoside-diphosphate sugar epimerase/dehydratase [Aeromonas enteropelogenes]|uniref:nucleoside-diphosphate sugar epimerase/dehydratase n=1 Tax=Aeromonas enteropelogenes TaxID=29489 RepID=UPI003BA2E2A4
MDYLSVTEQSEIWASCKNTSVRVGVWLEQSACANQMVSLIKQLSAFDQVEVFALTPFQQWELHQHWFEIQLSHCRLLSFQASEQNALSCVDIAILPESNCSTFAILPESVVRIGVPHGIDIDFERTVTTYGGAYLFDYVLSAQTQPDLEPNRFQGRFPQALRLHHRAGITEIPFGFPKLDEFIQSVTEKYSSTSPAIVYHLSNLDLEAPWVKELLLPTLEALLEAFPDNPVIFRPFQLDRQHPLVQRCRERGSRYSQFKFSDCDNYIDDYSRAAVMVCHRPYKLHLFGLATGRKTLLCHPDNLATQAGDPLFIPCSSADLINSVGALLKDTDPIPQAARVAHCQAMGIHNPGHAISTFVSNLNSILSGQNLSQWRCFPLDIESELSFKTHIALLLLAGRPADLGLLVLAERYPDYLAAKLFAASSFLKSQELIQYFYPTAFGLLRDLAVHPQLTDELRCLMLAWWQDRGRCCLLKYLDFCAQNHVVICDDAKWLAKNAMLNDPVLPLVERATQLIDLSTLKPVIQRGHIYIYGAGQIAQDFLTSPISQYYHVKGIVDGNQAKQGSVFAGLKVLAPAALESSSVPVLIASYSFLTEIYQDLRSKFGSQPCYAWCQDAYTKAFFQWL